MPVNPQLRNLFRSWSNVMARKRPARESRRNRLQSRSNRPPMVTEILEDRTLLSANPWTINLGGGPGGIDIFGPNAIGDSKIP